MSIKDKVLKKNKHINYNIYVQTMGILNASEPITIVTSQEPSIRLSCIQLWRHCRASNVKNVRKQAFQDISVRIFLLKAMKYTCVRRRCIPVLAKIYCCVALAQKCRVPKMYLSSILNAMYLGSFPSQK